MLRPVRKPHAANLTGILHVHPPCRTYPLRATYLSIRYSFLALTTCAQGPEASTAEGHPSTARETVLAHHAPHKSGERYDLPEPD